MQLKVIEGLFKETLPVALKMEGRKNVADYELQVGLEGQEIRVVLIEKLGVDGTLTVARTVNMGEVVNQSNLQGIVSSVETIYKVLDINIALINKNQYFKSTW